MAIPHGHIKLVWINNVLQLEGFGPFNEEGVVTALEDIQSHVLKRTSNHAPWQRLDILNYETIGSPKVMRVIGHSYLWSFSQGCSAIASVHSNQLQKAMLLDFAQESQTNMAVFDDRDSAILWLKDQRSQSQTTD